MGDFDSVPSDLPTLETLWFLHLITSRHLNEQTISYKPRHLVCESIRVFGK